MVRAKDGPWIHHVISCFVATFSSFVEVLCDAIGKESQLPTGFLKNKKIFTFQNLTASIPLQHVALSVTTLLTIQIWNSQNIWLLGKFSQKPQCHCSFRRQKVVWDASLRGRRKEFLPRVVPRKTLTASLELSANSVLQFVCQRLAPCPFWVQLFPYDAKCWCSCRVDRQTFVLLRQIPELCGKTPSNKILLDSMHKRWSSRFVLWKLTFVLRSRKTNSFLVVVVALSLFETAFVKESNRFPNARFNTESTSNSVFSLCVNRRTCWLHCNHTFVPLFVIPSDWFRSTSISTSLSCHQSTCRIDWI